MQILIDLDDTVVALMPAWVAAYNTSFSDRLGHKDVDSWNVWKLAKKCSKAEFYSILARPGFFDHLRPEESAIMAVGLLHEMGHDVRFATATPNADAARGKVEWVTREFKHLGFGIDRVIQIHDKARLSGDLLIDDKVDNIKAWRDTGRPAVCYGQRWNKELLGIVEFYSMRGQGTSKWAEIVQFIKENYGI